MHLKKQKFNCYVAALIYVIIQTRFIVFHITNLKQHCLCLCNFKAQINVFFLCVFDM